MANTMISISSIITNAEEICITGKDLDKILLADSDLSEEFEQNKEKRDGLYLQGCIFKGKGCPQSAGNVR